MDGDRCIATLKKDPTQRCINRAKAGKDGYCMTHYKMLRQVETKSKPKVEEKGNFSCLLCCRDDLPSSADMQLKCGDAICRDCFKRLGDKKCPYCRKEMESPFINNVEKAALAKRAKKFQQEVEDEAARQWDEENGEGDEDFYAEQAQNAVIQLMQNYNLAVWGNPAGPQIVGPNPERGSEEDSRVLNNTIEAVFNGELPSGGPELHDQLHERYDFSCGYITSIVERVMELL